MFVFIPDRHGGDAVAHPVPYPEPVDEPGVVGVEAPGVDGAAGVPAHEDAGGAQAGARHVRDGGHVLAVPGHLLAGVAPRLQPHAEHHDLLRLES